MDARDLSTLLSPALADGALAGRRVALEGALDGPRGALAAALRRAGAEVGGAGDLSVDGAGVARAAGGGGAIDTAASGLGAAVLDAAAGQAVVQALLRATNLAFAGRRVAVLGFGAVGRSVARAVGALDGRVVALDADPVRAAVARLDGHASARLGAGERAGREPARAAAGALAGVTVAVACGGEAAASLGALPAGTIVANASGRPLPARRADGPGGRGGRRPGIAGAGGLLLLAGGAPLVSPAGDGLPGEAAAVLLALQGLALAALAAGREPAPGDEARVAEAWLAARERPA